MSAAGGSSKGVNGASPNPNVTKLLRRINLTREEEAIADFTEDEEVEEPFSGGMGDCGRSAFADASSHEHSPFGNEASMGQPSQPPVLSDQGESKQPIRGGVRM